MASLERRSRDLRQELEEAVVDPLFSRRLAGKTDTTIPDIVLVHRQRRARERLLDALVSRGSANVPQNLQKEVANLVRRWAATGFHDAFEDMERFEIQCARDYDRVVAEESGDLERLLDVLDREYRRKVVEQLGFIELRGIQASHLVLGDLDALYVPLHLEPAPDYSEEGILKVLSRPRVEAVQALREHRHVLIVGQPGSGKSTLLSYLALRSSLGQFCQELGWKHDPLPLMIRVRSLKNATLTARSISAHLECREELVARALERQEAILFVDGLDEANPELRDSLIDSLHRFVRSHPEVHVVATSRPTGSPGEVEKHLHGLEPFRLMDLTREEVDSFIDRWCLAAEKSVRLDPADAEKEARAAATDLKARLAASYPVQRIATNPLLVTILCVVHRFLGRSIPEHRVTLYEKCTDALLYEWDRAKFEEGAAIGLLDAPAKRRLLMEVARRVHEEHAAEIPEQEVVRHFAATLPDFGRPGSDAKSIVAEIRDRSGLLVERRPGFFAFSHLTFQEYLCALDHVRTKDLEVLVRHYEEPWWHEVIVLAAGAPGGGGGVIPRQLLAKKNPVAIFLAAQCLETETDMPLSVRERIEKALQKMVPPRGGAGVFFLSSLGIVAAPILMRALQATDAKGRSYILAVLGHMDYDPAVASLSACAADEEPSVASIALRGRPFQLSIGGLAMLKLIDRAVVSKTAKLALKEAVGRVPLRDLSELIHHGMEDDVRIILENALKARSQETSAPKRARSTA